MASSGAPSQFSRLLRQSRVASFDPTIPQVYSTPPAYAARGDWGLKRPLPSNTAGSTASMPGSSSNEGSGALRYLEVQQIDTPEGQTTWKERERETLFVKRWAEADARLDVEKDQVYSSYTAGMFGPRPQTRYLTSSERYLPADVPGPIAAPADESKADREARLFNNRWRAMQKHHAERGAADPSYRNLDFMGEQSHSPAFGFDADKFTTRPRMMINYNALSDKHFERYIEQVRGQRGQWKAHFGGRERSRLLGLIRKRQERAYNAALEVQRDAERRGATKQPLPEIDPEAALARMTPVELDMLEQSRDGDATRDAFRMLEERTIDATTRPQNERLPGSSQPTTLHPHAGLQYSQPDPIFANVLAEPLPGRVMHEVQHKQHAGSRDYKTSNKLPLGRSVLVGGHVAYLPAPVRAQAPPTIDWSRQDPKQGTALFRIVKAHRTSQFGLGGGAHRDMITLRSDLGYVYTDVEVVKRNIDAPRTMTDAPIGSPDYIGKSADDPAKPVRRAVGSGIGPIDPARRPHIPLNIFSPNGERRNQRKGARLSGRLAKQAAGRAKGPDADSEAQLLDSLTKMADAAADPASKPPRR
ncbi:uncharacterized protein PFL1_03964 [Pseudozyma flocculosa PF-1]|uniref:Uncharacterized protein n=2 Tax=Pseudozyma flocculosa TaxID=84751 RepID=A0A5C3EXL6_9BASI|nr:uncharacterized protein PFL1_03964 [Pseudozyma flocculosa PF-1]EPQ28661.1 hypothetical protein PFL1_03964 [Pseudozyma flocculosa PF-1]SPO36610.1 uncharacterized protein PSFLO_02081 [Pseudozyma flocculosa]